MTIFVLDKKQKPLMPCLEKRARHLQSPLQAAAAVNSTRKALWDLLTTFSLPCEASTGAETKYNRERFGLPKTHALDAACTGALLTSQTGDQVTATAPSGKKKGQYTGRVAIRNFNIQTAHGVVQGIASKCCHLERSDGYHYQGLLYADKVSTYTNQLTEEQRFLPALKGWVSALSNG
jgi:hypothetical protein